MGRRSRSPSPATASRWGRPQSRKAAKLLGRGARPLRSSTGQPREGIMMYGPEAQKIVDYCQGVWDRERRSPGVYVLSAEEQAELSSEVATDGIAVSLLGGDPSVAVRVTSWINRSEERRVGKEWRSRWAP